MLEIDYSGANQMPPHPTVVFIGLLNAFLLAGLALSLVMAWIHARRARDAAASVTNDEPKAGRRAVLRGRVETQMPTRPAIVVTITQDGMEHRHKGNYSHTWTETARRIESEPFWLALKSGTRVRVEPGDEVFLVDKIETVGHVRTGERTQRTLRARLEAGEIAHVDGVLAEGFHDRVDPSRDGLYRGAAPAKGLVMHPGRGGMLVSTEPLAQRHERRVAAHRFMTIALAIALSVLNGVLLAGPHLVNAFGENVELPIRGSRTWVTRSKNSKTTHYAVTVEYETKTSGPRMLEDEVRYPFYARARAGELKSIPFRVVPWWPAFYSVGKGATIGPGRIVFSVLGVAVVALIYVLRVRNAREWYELTKLVERKPGRLPT